MSGDRPLGAMGGAGPIPLTSIDLYARRYHVSDFDLLRQMIYALDRVYLDHLARESKKKTWAEKGARQKTVKR